MEEPPTWCGMEGGSGDHPPLGRRDSDNSGSELNPPGLRAACRCHEEDAAGIFPHRTTSSLLTKELDPYDISSCTKFWIPAPTNLQQLKPNILT
ncbi:hypothetical protein Y1Q_0019647 [Alligator mississippiensis]|uniref:Uncharacterized protein n=1 Tax=Alligator mississippiensis TaxID=8496 RepID=A0A151PES8_ALLMI|nr:hypothetical protein Y1Q_0019647 [Alligator mississippiensis]